MNFCNVRKALLPMHANTGISSANATRSKLYEEVLATRSFLVLSGTTQTLLCLDGELWLTREGCIDDYILSAGEHFAIDCEDLIVIQALQPSRVQLMIKIH